MVLQILHCMRETILFFVNSACIITKKDAVTSMKSVINETQRCNRSLCQGYSRNFSLSLVCVCVCDLALATYCVPKYWTYKFIDTLKLEIVVGTHNLIGLFEG